MRRDIILTVVSSALLVIFNLIVMNLRLDMKFLKLNILLVIVSIILLGLIIYLAEKVKRKELLISNIVVQAIFSIRYYYLAIFILPLFLLLFRDGGKSIDLSNTILFLIFFFLPGIFPPSQNILIKKSFSLFNISLNEIIEKTVEHQVSLEVGYAKSLVLYGYDFAVQNLPIENYSMAMQLRKNLSIQVDKMGKKFMSDYIKLYEKNIENEATKMIDKYKVFIATAISLAIFTTIYVYFLFVKAYYFIFKKIMDKYL